MTPWQRELKAAALAYHAAGCAPIPISPGTKQPPTTAEPADPNDPRADPKSPLYTKDYPRRWRHGFAWGDYQTEQPSIPVIERWLMNFPDCWIGVACGKGSRSAPGLGLEVIDFDIPGKEYWAPGQTGEAPAYLPWESLLLENGYGDLLARLTLSRTRSGGIHVWYRCEEFEGSQDLAKRPSTAEELARPPIKAGDPPKKTQKLIETRGQGGQVVAWPSPGYFFIQGGLETIPTISVEERRALIDACRMFHEPLEEEEQSPFRSPAKPSGWTGKMAGEDFDERGSWAWILEPWGYKFVCRHGAYEYWRRPGKVGPGWSLRVGVGTRGDRLYCWSTDDVLPAGKLLTKFAVYTLLNHGGDFAASAKRLGELGYGDQSARRPVPDSGPNGARRDDPPAATTCGSPDGGSDLAPTFAPKKKKEGWTPGRGFWDGEELPERVMPKFSPTDFGNAERLVALFGLDLRYCHLWGKWLFWDGLVWVPDETGGSSVVQMTKAMIRSMARDGYQTEDEELRAQMLEWCGKCHSRQRLENTIALARYERGIPITPKDMDNSHELLTVANGTINLKTGELLEPDRGHLITKRIDIPYDPNARCDTWLAFLDRVFGGDEELKRYVWKALGYSLTGLTSEQVFFFLYGLGANGKSTFINVVMRIMGEYGLQAPAEIFMAKHTQQTVSNDIAMLRGARFVTSSETDEGRRLNEGLIKRLTGGDKITARFLNQEFFTFDPTFKIWMTGNHKPAIRGTDPAIWRRVVLIPFDVQIPPEERDPGLPEKLWAERAGILNWMIDGCAAWFREKTLGSVESIREAVAAYREESDVLGAFLDECTIVVSDGKISSSDFYRYYEAWAKKNNEYALPLRKFSIAMTERGEVKVSTRDGKFFLGREVVMMPAPESGPGTARTLYDD